MEIGVSPVCPRFPPVSPSPRFPHQLLRFGANGLFTSWEQRVERSQVPHSSLRLREVGATNADTQGGRAASQHRAGIAFRRV
jgi:hypothetical protein